MKKIFLIILSLFFIISFTTNAYSMAGMKSIANKVVKEALENLDILGSKIFGKGSKEAIDLLPTPTPKFHIYPLNPIARRTIEKIKEEYNKEYEEIITWDIPDDAPEDLSDDEKVNYHLSCVVVVQTPTTFGSGFYFNENTIITNQHVIENYKQVETKIFGSDKYIKGKVVAFSKKNDLAAIRTTNEIPHKSCNIEKTNNPKVLSEVIAVGHPEGLEFTVTTGTISAYRDDEGRHIQDLNSKEIVAIHMNTEIYPGSSGGPLFYKGVVIGVNTFGVENTNLNFAIHFNLVNNFISQNNL